MIKFGIIGCGNMGGAMLRQMLKAGIYAPEEVMAADKNAGLLDRLEKELGVHTTLDNREAAKAPCLLLAVKPQFLKDAVAEFAPLREKEQLILSIVAGCETAALQELLGNDEAHIVRVMPNTPAMVGEGVMAACRNAYVTRQEWETAMKMLSCMGIAEEVKENMMDAVTGLSGSSPAFAFLFLEALSDAGVRAGLPRAVSQRFAAQVLAGSGKLALETGLHPGQLKDMVTSPAGTTIEGVAALEKNGFRYAVMEAVEAAVKKSQSFHK